MSSHGSGQSSKDCSLHGESFVRPTGQNVTIQVNRCKGAEVAGVKWDDSKLGIGVKKRVDDCKVRSKKGDALYVNYVGTLEDGTEIDKSSKYDEPFPVTLGYGQVIKGWEQGLMGMCVGETRKLVIPPDLAYGSPGALPKVPPDATVIFTIELVELVPREDLSNGEEIMTRSEL